MMEIGNNYTRAEIAEKLGGSRIDFLPRVGRKVVCACLRMDLNPDAPEIILAGFGTRIEESAEAICEQGGPIPVFIRQQANAWKYIGNFRVERCSTDANEIKSQEARSGRTGHDGVSRIIYMKKAQDE